MLDDFLLPKEMTGRIKQRYCIKFWEKLSNNQTKTLKKFNKFLEMRP